MNAHDTLREQAMQRRISIISIGLGAVWIIAFMMMSFSGSVDAQFRPSPVPYLPGTPI
jgi:hypothetical protein